MEVELEKTEPLQEVILLIHEVSFPSHDEKESHRPYLEVVLRQEGKKRVVCSKPYQKKTCTRNVQFFEEVFVTLNQSFRFSIKVMCTNPPQRDEILGRIDLKFNTSMKLQKPQWLELLGPTNGRILVEVIKKNPTKLNEYSDFERLKFHIVPRIKCILHGRRDFYVGERMCGVVRLSVGEPFYMKKIKIYFEGIEFSHWEDIIVGSNQTTRLPSGDEEVFQELKTVIKYESSLFDCGKNDLVLVESGTHEYMFDFTIPGHIVPSFEMCKSKSKLYYQFRIVVDQKGESNSHTSKFFIHRDLRSLPAPTLSEAISDSCHIGKGRINSTGEINSNIAFPDSALTLNLEVTNNSHKNIDDIEITCRQSRILRAQYNKRKLPRHISTVSLKTIQENTFPMLPAAALRNFVYHDENAFKKLRDISVNDEVHSPLIKNEYFFRVVYTIEGKKYNGLEFPFEFHLPNTEMKDIPLPSLPVEKPGTFAHCCRSENETEVKFRIYFPDGVKKSFFVKPETSMESIKKAILYRDLLIEDYYIVDCDGVEISSDSDTKLSLIKNLTVYLILRQFQHSSLEVTIGDETLSFPYEPRKKLSEIILPLLEAKAKSDHVHHFAAFVLGNEIEFDSLVGVLPHNSIKLKDTHHESNLKFIKTGSLHTGVRKRNLSFGFGNKEKHNENHQPELKTSKKGIFKKVLEPNDEQTLSLHQLDPEESDFEDLSTECSSPYVRRI